MRRHQSDPSGIWSIIIPGLALLVLLSARLRGIAADLASYDFAAPEEVAQWGQPHDLKVGNISRDGLTVQITGDDPYFSGPAREFPGNQLLWMSLRLKSDEGGSGQLFFFERGATEENSIHFFAKAGQWTTVRLPLPALWPKTHFRLDPPGTSGTCTFSRLSFEARQTLEAPDWPAITAIPDTKYRVKSGAIALEYAASNWGSFVVRINSRSFATGNPQSLLGYFADGQLHWMPLTNRAEVRYTKQGLSARALFKDGQAGTWEFKQTFSPSPKPGGIEIESAVSVDQDRQVAYLPMWTLLAGNGSFGTNKTQGLFAGLEYLENEPSSSKADLEVAAYLRRVPHTYKITLPLMALSASGSYLGFMWEQQAPFAALYDSPDRLFKSGGHVMGMIYPGADPSVRDDGQLLPYEPAPLKARQTLILHATLVGGSGDTVVPAVQQYIARKGLPALPQPGLPASEFYKKESRAWLDSDIRDGAKFRHAVGGNFSSGPAMDAAYYMDWLAQAVNDPSLAARLAQQAGEARKLIPPGQYSFSAIGHIRSPVAALAYGAVAENTAAALSQGQAILSAMKTPGTVYYAAPAGKTDLGHTHWSREANGLAATQIATLLDCAAFSGNPELIRDALTQVRALSKFHHTVPRGAQTWEVPLHTPDILASAYLVKIYTLAYELAGEHEFLEEATYWAWTGVPFVYLASPTGQAVGTYSTIAVLGATEFAAPVWMGLPVQWCGLVYADAIRRFAEYDSGGPWLQLANGIAASGIQQIHPESQPGKQGLLPDSFDLINQTQNPVPINPATLMSQALPFYSADPLYDFHSFRKHGILVHAPGPIADARETGVDIHFSVKSWAKPPWHVLINGIRNRPTLRLNGTATKIEGPHVFRQAEGQIILKLEAPTTVDIGQ